MSSLLLLLIRLYGTAVELNLKHRSFLRARFPDEHRTHVSPKLIQGMVVFWLSPKLRNPICILTSITRSEWVRKTYEKMKKPIMCVRKRLGKTFEHRVLQGDGVSESGGSNIEDDYSGTEKRASIWCRFIHILILAVSHQYRQLFVSLRVSLAAKEQLLFYIFMSSSSR